MIILIPLAHLRLSRSIDWFLYGGNIYRYKVKFFRSSRLQMFFKTSVLKNFAIFIGNHFYWCLFLAKLQALRHTTLLKRYSNTVVFLWMFAKFIRTICRTYNNLYNFIKRLWWLLLVKNQNSGRHSKVTDFACFIKMIF